MILYSRGDLSGIVYDIHGYTCCHVPFFLVLKCDERYKWEDSNDGEQFILYGESEECEKCEEDHDIYYTRLLGSDGQFYFSTICTQPCCRIE